MLLIGFFFLFSQDRISPAVQQSLPSVLNGRRAWNIGTIISMCVAKLLWAGSRIVLLVGLIHLNIFMCSNPSVRYYIALSARSSSDRRWSIRTGQDYTGSPAVVVQSPQWTSCMECRQHHNTCIQICVAELLLCMGRMGQHKRTRYSMPPIS